MLHSRFSSQKREDGFVTMRCILFVDNKGFSLFNIPPNNFEFLHAWNAGSS